MDKLVAAASLLCLFITCVHSTPAKGPKPLSDEPHTVNGEHNPEYDHEAFLGEEEAAEFDKLPVEESKRRLRIVCGKIDTDQDGYLTHDELQRWVAHISHTYIAESVQDYFPEQDENSDGKVSWTEYKESVYGEIQDETDVYDPDRDLTYQKSISRDEKRFKVCDEDNDGMLDEEEYMAFIHPEEFRHTRDLHIDEAFDDMDKNKDGSIVLEEYVEDIWPTSERIEGEEEPEWVKDEKEQFREHRDVNGDNKMNKEEFAQWVSPEDYDSADAEASHLVYHADQDKDGKLSIEEVIDNHELFVGSQATDFGSYLNRHDEF